MPSRVTKLKPYAVAAATFLTLWYGGFGSSASAQSGSVVQVSTEGELQQAVAHIASDTMIVIAPGTYRLSSTLTINRPVNNVAIRGATDNANDVVLIGRGMDNASFDAVPHGISTGVNVVGVTIANLTIRDVYYHAIMLAPGTESPRIQNVRLIDAGRQFVKAYPDGKGGGVDDGLIERSIFEYSRTSRDSDTGGLEVNTGSRWLVRDNVFRNITAPTGQIAGPALLFWNGSRDSVIERNTFINSQREIALGSQDRTPNDHTGGVVRNNFLYREPGIQGGQPAIYIADSPNTQVLHNTILGNGTATSLIQYRYRDTRGVVIRNNLLDGQIAARNQASGTVADNHTSAAPSMFVNAAAGDLHLASGAADVIDRAPVQAFAGPDFDGETRPLGAAADFGADEFSGAQLASSAQASGSGTTAPVTLAAAAAPSAGPSARGPLPLPWQTTDVGSPEMAGAAGWSSGVFAADGGGTDIGGNADQFRFIYQTLDGDGEVVARVDSMERTNLWAKAGIMIRDELTAGAKHASALVTPNKGVLFQRRIANDAVASQTITSGGTPVWLRIVRKGNAFTAFRSTNGTAWTQIGSEVVYLKRLVYVGLVVNSHSARSLSTATFSNVQVTPIASTPNQPPTVSLTAPANGATYTTPATMTVSASASDTDGTIAAVEFYAGGTSIGSDSSSPYSVTWSDAPAGTHTLTAVARDNAGATTTSSSRQITVSTPSNKLPTVTLTGPANGAAFTAPASIALSATASDSDGTIARVDFFAGTTKVGSDTSSPYSATWAAPAGNHAVTAVAVDNTGATATSAAAQIAVSAPANQPPAVSLSSPTNGATFTAPAAVSMAATATDMDGTIAKVEFYAGSTLVATDTSTPFSATWNNAAAGTYTISAKAFDNVGATTISSGVNITVQTASTLPAGWLSADVGNPALAGDASYASGTFTLTSAGVGIWDTSDQFRYVYRPLQGDGEISACVDALDYGDGWTKAGVMIRESMSPGSPNALAVMSGGYGVTLQWRAQESQPSTWTGWLNPGVPPHCLRLVRSGNTFRAYESWNGTDWVSLGEQAITMGQSAFIGLATAPHQTDRVTTRISRVSVTNAPPANQPPQVSLTTPANGASFAAPASVVLGASATDADGSVASVSFYAGGMLLGTDNTAPYGMTWSNVAAGTYSITALAQDNAGGTRTSSAVSITVSGSTPQVVPRGVVFNPSSNHDTSVDSYIVEFFTAGSNTTTATPVRTQDVGKPTPVNNEINVDVTTTIQALAAGSYVSTVRATGPGGSTRSAPSQSFVR